LSRWFAQAITPLLSSALMTRFTTEMSRSAVRPVSPGRRRRRPLEATQGGAPERREGKPNPDTTACRPIGPFAPAGELHAGFMAK
jgi:hypothetical protein